MAQQRIRKPRRVADTRRKAREDEQEGERRPEIREDIRRTWFEER